MRLAIANAMIAIPVDDRTSRRDKFTWLQTGQRDVSSTVDRGFTLRLSAQPQRAEPDVISTFLAEYQMAIDYVSVPGPAGAEGGVEDRMAKDAERIYATMDRLHTQDADINLCTCSPVGVSEVSGAIQSSWSLVVNYRLTAGVE